MVVKSGLRFGYPAPRVVATFCHLMVFLTANPVWSKEIVPFRPPINPPELHPSAETRPPEVMPSPLMGSAELVVGGLLAGVLGRQLAGGSGSLTTLGLGWRQPRDRWTRMAVRLFPWGEGQLGSGGHKLTSRHTLAVEGALGHRAGAGDWLETYLRVASLRLTEKHRDLELTSSPGDALSVVVGARYEMGITPRWAVSLDLELGRLSGPERQGEGASSLGERLMVTSSGLGVRLTALL